MYGKLFTAMYDGTLVEDWRALITFQQMIVLSDSDGIVDMTSSSISRRTGIPLEHIEAGIKKLESADQYSRTNKDDGRRIVLIDEHRPWGWLIVNHKYYRDLASREDKREKDRIRISEKRAQAIENKEVSQPVASSSEQSQKSPIQDADTYTKASSNSKIKSDQILEIFEFWKLEMSHPRAKMDDKRKKLIQKALKTGYTIDDCKNAISGCKLTPWNMGINPDGQMFDSIELILRDSEKIDRFIANFNSPPVPKNDAERRYLANAQAAREAMEIIGGDDAR